ncbi:phosphate acetyltransferase [Anaerobacterium chartisolvens]|uniref:Phosphate acetyltransferase n=1 Tax=Anaerobacterium chartisolvens TaxID=1297424 RepID=A0A369B3M7_9FIRM|nr:phosphate acyltransferase [Anaerobacterium chartisolvens]RCX16041.1 phosphate acetyltransferase [Anaerobacterium chartisolvens]
MGTDFMSRLLERAKAAPKRIIFPEAENEKVIQAARRIKDMGIAYPILVSKKGTAEGLAAGLNISTDGFDYIDNTDETILVDTVRSYLAVSSELTEKTLNRKLKAPLNFAAAMVKIGRADCLAAGIDHTTGEVILASQMFIGMEEGISTISSIGIVEAPGYQGSEGNLLAITDCAVCQNPNASELADIACTSSDTMKSLLGWEPRAALICFSTDGSGQHEITEKVVEAVRLANERRPDLAIDGEFQLDAALNPMVAAKKVKRESGVAGRANIIVFPDLNAGNIGVKLIQTFGNALAHGPLLQGFAKPVTDFSRSAPVDEIVGNLVMLVVRAGK